MASLPASDDFRIRPNQTNQRRTVRTWFFENQSGEVTPIRCRGEGVRMEGARAAKSRRYTYSMQCRLIIDFPADKQVVGCHLARARRVTLRAKRERTPGDCRPRVPSVTSCAAGARLQLSITKAICREIDVENKPCRTYCNPLREVVLARRGGRLRSDEQ